MSTTRLIVYFAAWVAASLMMAVVAAVLVVEVVRLVGIAESGSTSYEVVLNVTFLVTAIALIAVPFVFRARFNRYEPPPEDP
jgi:hypothetical protein